MKRFLGENENFLGIPDNVRSSGEGGILILQVPFEKTSSFGRGAAEGPEAVVCASRQVEFRDAQLGFSPLEECGGIYTLAPYRIDGHDGNSLSSTLEREVREWLEEGRRVVTLGGEHTSVIGAIKAYVGSYDDVTVLQLDAHSDLRESYQGDRWSHACAMKRVLDFHQDIVQVGIRSESEEDRRNNRRYRLPVFYGEDIIEQGSSTLWIEKVVDSLSDNVYISFDCDVLDPSIMPATGTPEPGGLTWHHIDYLFSRLCERREVIGFDISELSPINGLHHPQFTIAKLVYRLIGYMSNPDQ